MQTRRPAAMPRTAAFVVLPLALIAVTALAVVRLRGHDGRLSVDRRALEAIGTARTAITAHADALAQYSAAPSPDRRHALDARTDELHRATAMIAASDQTATLAVPVLQQYTNANAALPEGSQSLAPASSTAAAEAIADMTLIGAAIEGRVNTRLAQSAARRQLVEGVAVALIAGSLAGLWAMRAVMARRWGGDRRDPATGLGGHSAFQEELKQQASAALHHDRPLSIVSIDVDNFRDANDERGHRYGDDLLAGLAALLRDSAGAGRAYRVGGDEFGLLLPGHSRTEARIAVERIRAAGKTRLSGATFSAGVATLLPPDGSTDTAVQQAAAALSEAKRVGKNTTIVYDDVRADAPAIISSTTVRSLRQLLTERQMATAFQPIWGVGGARIIAYEALARPPQGYGFQGPAEAFEVAERTGRAHDLDALCRQVVLSRARELPTDAMLFLNLSPQALDRGLLNPEALAQAVRAAGLLPSRVVIEITERAVVRLGVVSQEAQRLRDLGFKLALDDVGAGNAGLEMMRGLPVDWVKIDRDVVANALTDATARGVFMAITAFAREARSWVLAEGIETPQMLDFAMQAGAQALQGYLLGRPAAQIATTDQLYAEQAQILRRRPVAPRAAEPDRVTQLAPVRRSSASAS